MKHQYRSLENGQQEDAPSSPFLFAGQQDPTLSVSMPDGQAAWALLWLDHQPLAHVILSKELTILWANAKAQAVLAQRRDIHSCENIFTAVEPYHQQDLHDFLIGSHGVLTSWSMPRADGDGRMIFRTQRFETALSSVIMVSFFGSGSDFQSTYADLDRVFKLTKAQHGVLLDLLGGHDADAIAQLRNISVETVRTHIRIIYSKIGVNSREALFHILQPFRL